MGIRTQSLHQAVQSTCLVAEGHFTGWCVRGFLATEAKVSAFMMPKGVAYDDKRGQKEHENARLNPKQRISLTFIIFGTSQSEVSRILKSR